MMVSRCCEEKVRVEETESGADYVCDYCSAPCDTKLSFWPESFPTPIWDDLKIGKKDA